MALLPLPIAGMQSLVAGRSHRDAVEQVAILFSHEHVQVSGEEWTAIEAVNEPSLSEWKAECGRYLDAESAALVEAITVLELLDAAHRLGERDKEWSRRALDGDWPEHDLMRGISPSDAGTREMLERRERAGSVTAESAADRAYRHIAFVMEEPPESPRQLAKRAQVRARGAAGKPST